MKIRLMVQDHPISGVPMSADFLAKLSGEIENSSYFKLEFTQSSYRIAKVLEQTNGEVKAMFGGESGVYLLEEYERGGRGAIPGCYMPLINFELRLANRNCRIAFPKNLA